MDLILWRHAEAVDQRAGRDDLSRALTAEGKRQAAQMAAWLNEALPKRTRILVSPARRTQQTVAPLGRPCQTVEAIAPDAEPEAVLAAAGWPDAKQPVMVVGHQPTLGLVAARLMAGPGFIGPPWTIRKAGVWWLRTRQREGEGGVVLVTVRGPDNLTGGVPGPSSKT